MKAVVRDQYGPPDILRLQEVRKPSPRDDEVLIKLHAVSLNLSDWEILTGRPFYSRIWGLFRPRVKILGSDIAGRVEAVGPNANQLKPGDAVFGDIMGPFGGFAEYVCVREETLLLKPSSLTFEQAAALPQAAVIALRGIRDKGQVQPRQRVLVNGAGGGSGMFAVQLAKSYGAIVTGVDNTEKQDFMRSIGADHVVDYTREDFSRSGQRYDLILDLVAHRSIFDHRRALASGGVYLLVGGSMSRLIQVLLLGPLLSLTGSKQLRMLAVNPKTADLASVLELLDTGKMKVFIDRRYPLSEVADALRHVGEGHALGKVIITL